MITRSSPPGAGGLVVAVFLIASAWSLAYGGDTPARSEIRVTLEVEDQTLDQALAALSALIGQEIEVTGRIDKRRVSAILDGATLDDSLARLLRPQSYIVLWSPEGRLSLHVLGGPEDSPAAEDDDAVPSGATDGLPPSLYPEGPEVLPPDRPGEPGLTAADVAYYRSFTAPVDPLDLEVVPPSSPGEAGITQAEFDFENEIRPVLDPSEIEVVPPANPGEPGLTLAEFEFLTAGRPAVPPSEIEVLPPDEPGGVGLTLEEFHSLPKPEPIQRPLAEEVPPE